MERLRQSAPRARCGAVWLATTAVTGALQAWLVPDLLGHAPDAMATPRFDAVLVVACEAAAALGLGWLWVLVTLVTFDAARGVQRRRTGVPTAVRRGVLLACGLGLASGLAVPAHADPADRTGVGAGAESPLTGLQLPDRTTASPGQRFPGAPAADRGPPRTVVVAPGDTLWDLAAADLPPGADARLIDAHWRAIHAANRVDIGPDPDLIHPGLRLRLPPVPSRP